jgi:hypothetical protein
VTAVSARGEGELDPALSIGCVGGREIEIARGGVLPRVLLGKDQEGLADDAVVLHLAAMPVPEHEDRRSLFQMWGRAWLWCPTGFLFLPWTLHFSRAKEGITEATGSDEEVTLPKFYRPVTNFLQ